MESDLPAYEGFLLLPPSGKILKKTWQKKYCILYERSSSGLARIEIYENSAKTGQPKIITLEDVIKITPKSSTVINIVTKHSCIDFMTTSDEELSSWFDVLKKVAFSIDSVKSQSIEEDNDLYCSSEEGVFYVKLHPSDASQRCNLASKNYILVITSAALHLRNEIDNELLYTWPFSYIRKYGYKGGKFTFEAGRKCATGEGVFYLEHPNHNEIYRCLSTKMKNMKKLLNRDPVSLLDCNDSVQLHAALSMEPGSRNPLPPSITSQSSFTESNKSAMDLHLSSVMSSLENLILPKEIPKKPPRKSLDLKNDFIIDINNAHDYVDLQKYDTVENRTEAWKTLGIQEPVHSEPIPKEPWIHSNTNLRLNKLNTSAPAVINEPTKSPVDENYDCLQHFGSTTAINNTSYKAVFHCKSDESINHFEHEDTSWTSNIEEPHAPTLITENMTIDDQSYDHLNFFGQMSTKSSSSDYKQVISPISIQPKPNFNLYEEVNIVETVRMAVEDAQSGYACIKKDTNKPKEETNSFDNAKLKEEPQNIAHEFQNHQPYAVISKTKRV
ncbi:hypothetical protein ABEB36_005243 [Hypothenemus hampei]|uniref:Insulin receptor substrate 1 n=1 Tax=Hypothenemus hampei TaxID=57062 RepID=A0ABD1EXX6_HYPHA